MKYLDKIESPSDIKNLSKEELSILAEEIREVLIQTVSKTGGHLASNLGVVELTIALHYLFDSPKDKFIWDVGHQAYTHKILTGRYKDFDTLRQEDGLSGFCSPKESEHDIFYSGHSSTSISSALGIATANAMFNDKHTTIAIIGDGAFTGGLAYEALNNAGRSGKRLIVILNDNEMSISPNVGSVARYLAVLRSKPGYFLLKERTETILKHIPLLGKPLCNAIIKTKTRIKNRLYKSTFFEELGFRYMGPMDGNNLDQLIDALRSAKMYNQPILFHINTKKGKGYNYAEKSPSEFHGISKFNIDTGEPLMSGANFSSEFGNFLCDVARKDKRICAITAAMSLGTGLEPFRREFPDRFFDVGIAEEHAVTFSSGLAKGGAVPIFAVYSTFLQRTFDQLVHDGTMQNLHMILAIDRAGFVGADGISHQGILDVALLNGIPNMTVYAPATYKGLKHAFVEAIYHQSGVIAIRYPRGSEPDFPNEVEDECANYEVHGHVNPETILVSYGRISADVIKVCDTLQEQGQNVAVVKLNRIVPIQDDAVSYALQAKQIFFFEEGILRGGIGESFGYALTQKGYKGYYHVTAVPEEFVVQASVDSQLQKYHLEYNGMLSEILECENGGTQE